MKKLFFAFFLVLLAASTSLASVSIDATSFPDSVFRQYISDNFDLNKDGTLSDSEIDAVEKIDVRGKGISSLEGIKVFTNLWTLDCSKNGLTKLDLRNMSNLLLLSCTDNSIGNNLNIAGCSKLKFLACSMNEMDTIDLTVFPALEYFSCFSNNFSTLDVSSNTKLTKLRCWGNALTQLDVSKNIALMDLDCRKNKISTLDLSKNTALKNLDCSSNALKSLTIDPNTALKDIFSANNSLVSLTLPASEVLSSVALSPQTLTGLKVTTESGKYTVNLLNDGYGILNGDLANISSVKAYDNNNAEITISESTPTSGMYSFATSPVLVTYQYAADDAHNMQVNISAKPSITVTTLEKGYLNRRYSTYFEAIGNGTLKWSIDDVSKLPSGLNFYSSTGRISGTPNGTTGKYTFNLTVTDSNNETDTKECTLEIGSSSESPESIAITTINSDIPVGYENVRGYSYRFGATTSGTWSMDKVPDGLTFSSSGGLSGTPTKAGNFVVNVTVTDSKGGTDKQSFTISIKSNSEYANRPKITTAQGDISTAYVSNKYTQEFTAETTQTTRWYITNGSIPGVSMLTRGVLSGYPKQIGTYQITVRALASDGGFEDKDFTVTVQAAEQAPAQPTIITRSLANAYVNRDYSAQLEANGTTPITWSITSGSLPSGITLSSTGLISGKASKADSYSITVQATNSAGYAQRTLSFTVREENSQGTNNGNNNSNSGNNNSNNGGGSSSGGGCNSALYGLLPLAFVVMKKRS